MSDFIIAIYRVECYAGETTFKLEKVLLSIKEIPEKYYHHNYIIKYTEIINTFEN